MKRLILSVLLSFTLIFISTVFSKELVQENNSEGSLSEKIVNNFETDLITNSESIKLKYKAGKGLEFKGRDAFKVKLGTRIQARFDYTRWNREKRSSPGSTIDGITGRGADSQIRRFNIYIKGYVYIPNVFYKYVLCSDKNGTECAGSDSGLGIEDAYIGYKFGDAKKPFAKFTYGQMKVPWTLEELNSSSNLEFVDRSSKHITFARDNGLKFDGYLKNFATGTFYFGTGLGSNTKRNTSDLDVNDNIYVTRLEVHPFGPMKKSQGDLKKIDKLRMRVSTSYLSWKGIETTYSSSAFSENVGGKFDDRLQDLWKAYRTYNGKTSYGLTQLDVTGWTYDVALKYKGFSLEGEHTTLKGSENTLSIGNESINWRRLQGSYHIMDGWSVGYRYGERDQSDKADDLITEHTYMISKYFVGHNLKINADYGYINEEQGLNSSGLKQDKKQTKTFRLQAQLKF